MIELNESAINKLNFLYEDFMSNEDMMSSAYSSLDNHFNSPEYKNLQNSFYELKPFNHVDNTQNQMLNAFNSNGNPKNTIGDFSFDSTVSERDTALRAKKFLELLNRKK